VIAADGIPLRTLDVFAHVVEGTLFLCTDSGNFELSAAGAAVYRACDGIRRVDDIVAVAARDAYGGDRAAARGDVLWVMDRLTELGAVEWPE
jgi:Coenzyme PQQ synthesis protein D (PqqD)